MRPLRSPPDDARAPDGAPRVRVVSPDPRLSASIARWLRTWGASVAVESDVVAATVDERLDVALVDVRRCDDALLARLAALKRARPALEVILLNLPGQVAVSIAAMRSGASSELTAPFDLATLRVAVSAALRRRRQRLGARRLTLLERFQRAMSAATFAQAGEFETAREILADGDPPAPRGRGRDRRSG